MTISSETALTLFHSGYNCAQSVLLAYADIFKHDREKLEALSLGFGGGMGRLQRTCGAVTGAFMVISLHTANTTSDHDECSERVRESIQDFHQRFIARHGNSDCRDLLGYDINTDAGRKRIEKERQKEKVCVPCVESAIAILNDLLNI